MRFNPREYQRNNHRSQKIGQQCIRGKTRRTSAQLTGNDRSSSSRRTNKTYHSPFKNFPIHLLHWTAHQQSRHNQTRHRLKQQQPAMPSFGFKSRASTLQKVSSNCAKSKPESGEPPTRSNKVLPVQTREFSQRRNIRPYRQASPKAMSNSL